METNYYENLIPSNNTEMEKLIIKQNNILDKILESFIILRKRQEKEDRKIMNDKLKTKKSEKIRPNSFLEYID